MTEKSRESTITGQWYALRAIHLGGISRKKFSVICLWTLLFFFLLNVLQQIQVEAPNHQIHYINNSNKAIYHELNVFKCIDSYTPSDLILSPPSPSPSCSGLILEKDMCKDINETKVFLMIIIETSPGEFDKRQAIRESWGSVVRKDKSVRVMFLLGRGNNSTLQDGVEKESKIYHDIAQGDFIDSYKNLTIKSFLLLKWTAVFCKEARYVAKVDTDIFLNVPHLLQILKTQKYTKSVLGRKVYISLPIRDKKSKWYTSTDIYPDLLYPTYIAGPAYVLSVDLVSPLLRVCFHKTFPWEDIFITGICASKVQAHLHMDWTFAKERRKPEKCSFVDVVTGHGQTPSEMKQIWDEINNDTIHCPVNLVQYWKKYLY